MNAPVRGTNQRGTWDHRPELAAVRALMGWTTSTQSSAAAALAMSRIAPSDWRCDCLPWFFGHGRDSARIHAALCRVVARTVERESISTATLGARWTAVDDAMNRVRERRCPSAATRAKEFRLAKASFLKLRNSAETALLNAIRDGLERYLEAFG